MTPSPVPVPLPDTDQPSVPVLTDWSRSVSFRPRLYYRPQTVDDLKRCLSDLLAGRPWKPDSIRVPGSLHSTCDIVVSDAIIDIYDLPHTLEYDADFGAVTASANWRLHDFLIELSRCTPRGKSLCATGGTDEQTLAGVISTNTAPPTSRVTMFDQLEWVEFLTVGPDGTSVVERRVARTDPDFPAMVCSLGAIGIITRVRFTLIDEPYYHVVQKVVGLETVLKDLDATAKLYDFWRINWIPDSDEGLLWAATLINGKGDPAGDYPTDKSEGMIRIVMRALQSITHAGPVLDWPENLLLKGLALAFGTEENEGPLRNMIPIDRHSPLTVALSEWSFDPADTDRVLATCRDYYKKAKWPNLPIEIQLTKTDSHYMSPWNWPGLDRIIKFDFQYLTEDLSPAQITQISTHLDGLWRELEARNIPFKAHWGKINSLTYDRVKQIHQLDKFAPLIRTVFLNDYLRTRLLPTK
jgi:hypothetical protein